MDQDFSFAGKEFRLNKINALKQFHIVRRVAPLLTELMPALKDASRVSDLKQVDKMSESDKLDMVAKFAGPVMTGLSRLSDEDADKVLYGLLSSVEIKNVAGGWSKVSTDTMLMFQDLELPSLLNIAGRAFMFNLSSFFSVLPA